MTRRPFVVKVTPSEGYDVYRFHLSRGALTALAAALVLVVVGALGAHAWQLRGAENGLRVLQAQAAAQDAQLGAIDRQADALAAQLRDVQRRDNEIRRALGIGGHPRSRARGAPAVPANHADAAPPPSLATVRARLQRLTARSAAARAEVSRLGHLTHRVLDLRRMAQLARNRMIAALPSINPVGGRIASAFGWRAEPWPEFHAGLDLEADYGTPVRAAADASVVATDWEDGFGNKVDLDHGNGYHTWYAHLSRFAVEPGERVRRGQIIAFVGATGDATGPHLHYQVMRDGRPIDPRPFLDGVPRAVLATLPAAPRVQ